MTAVQAAQASDLQQSTISRAESATILLHATSLRVLLQVYGASPEEELAARQLHKSAREPSFWHPYRTVLPGDWFSLFVDLETEASHLSIYDGSVINGLFQVPDYMIAMFRAAYPQDSNEETDRKVQLRLERQERIRDGHLSVRAVVDQAALLRHVGPPHVMVQQIRRLSELAATRNVTLQVLPLQAAVVTGVPFTIMDFPIVEGKLRDPTIVYIEHQIGALFLEDETDVRWYAGAFGGLQAAACSPNDTDDLLAQTIATIEGNQNR